MGGWEVTGIYNFQSGTPLVLPTNSAFYRGDASPNSNVTKGRTGTYFDTSAFVPYPTKTTPIATIQTYPSWTGVVSAAWLQLRSNALRTPRRTASTTTSPFATLSIRKPSAIFETRPSTPSRPVSAKNFNFTDTIRLQLRLDATNLLNHPQFGNIGTDPTSAYFGRLSGAAVSDRRQRSTSDRDRREGVLLVRARRHLSRLRALGRTLGAQPDPDPRG